MYVECNCESLLYFVTLAAKRLSDIVKVLLHVFLKKLPIPKHITYFSYTTHCLKNDYHDTKLLLLSTAPSLQKIWPHMMLRNMKVSATVAPDARLKQ